MHNPNLSSTVPPGANAADHARVDAQDDVVVAAETPLDWEKVGKDIAARYPVTLAELAK